jgi:uncharacterized protein
MLIETEVTVASPAEELYRLMLDVERVIPCLPGAELVGRDNGTYTVKLGVKLGPMSLSYSGTVAIAEQDDAARRAVMQAEAAEQRGQGNVRATMSMAVADEAEHRSRLHVSSDVLVTGRVAQMGRGIMQDVATKLLSDMAACLEQALSQTASAREPQPTELSALSLLRSVVSARVRRFVRR